MRTSALQKREAVLRNRVYRRIAGLATVGHPIKAQTRPDMMNDQNNVPRDLPWRSPKAVTALVAAVVFFALGARAVVDPAGASAFFGASLDGGPGFTFVAAMGARNMALAVCAAMLVALDQRRALALLLAASAGVAIFDALAVYNHGAPTYALKHVGYVAGLGGFSAWVGVRR
jgi:hypothetical protein